EAVRQVEQREVRVPEQSDPKNRIPHPGLPISEGRERSGGNDAQQYKGERIVSDRLQTVQRQQARGEAEGDQQSPGNVERSPRRQLTPWRDRQREQQCRQRDRASKPEYRRPPPCIDEQPAERRPDGLADREHGYVQAEYPRPQPLLEQARGKSRTTGDDKRRSDSLRGTENEQRLETPGDRTEREGQGADREAANEHDPVAEKVAELPERQQQARIGQHVADDDPLDVLQRQSE